MIWCTARPTGLPGDGAPSATDNVFERDPGTRAPKFSSSTSAAMRPRGRSLSQGRADGLARSGAPRSKWRWWLKEGRMPTSSRTMYRIAICASPTSRPLIGFSWRPAGRFGCGRRFPGGATPEPRAPHEHFRLGGSDLRPRGARRRIPVKIGIMAHPQKPKALELVPRALALLRDRAQTVVSDETASHLHLDWRTTPRSNRWKLTLWSRSAEMAPFCPPYSNRLPHCSPSMRGRSAFSPRSSGSQPKALETALDRLVRGDYFLESRMKLSAQLKGANLPDATNEIVVHFVASSQNAAL